MATGLRHAIKSFPALAAAAGVLALTAAPSQAAEPFPALFDAVPLGATLDSARRALTGAGARIVRTEPDTTVADLRCTAGDAACRRRNTHVGRLVATHKGVLYSIALTSALTRNRVYQVAMAANLPSGLTAAGHRKAISEKLDRKAASGSGAIALWRLNDDGHMLMVSWTGIRFSAVRRDGVLLREDRIAIDRLRRR